MSRSRTGNSSSQNSGMTNPNLEKTLSDLREATRQAHEVLKDMRLEIKRMEEVRDTTALVVEAITLEKVDAAVDRILEELGPELRRQMDKSVETVSAEFQKLHDMVLGKKDANGKTAIHRLIEQRKDKGTVEVVIGEDTSQVNSTFRRNG